MKSVTKKISTGTAHKVPADLRKVLTSDSDVLAKWNSLTPLARNEWICWTVSVKRAETRKDHVKRAAKELKEGKRRPCCWMGCVHRSDKPISASQKYVLGRQSKKKS